MSALFTKDRDFFHDRFSYQVKNWISDAAPGLQQKNPEKSLFPG